MSQQSVSTRKIAAASLIPYFRLRDEYGMTVLYTTHMMEEAQELSDRVAIMDHGELIAVGTQGELTQQVGEEDRLIISFRQRKPIGRS